MAENSQPRAGGNTTRVGASGIRHSKIRAVRAGRRSARDSRANGRASGSRTAGAAAMRRISLRSIGAHKLRLALTILAVVLGTAFVSGSFVFTASMSRTFDSLVDESLSGIDAVLTPGDKAGPVLPPNTLELLKSTPGVERANISAETAVVIAKGDRKPLETAGAPSQIQPIYLGDASVSNPPTLVDGRAPTGGGEVIINERAAKAHDVKVGDPLLVIDPIRARPVTVSGIYSSGTATGGFIGLGMDPAAYASQYLPGGALNRVFVKASNGTSQQQVLSTLRERFPNAKVRTGQEVSDEVTGQISQALSFINYFLLAFGLVGLLVGTFIIANTFSMIVAQRTREFALLRSLGVSSGQLTGSVVMEALVVGVIGSLLGIAAGVGLVSVIQVILDKVGYGLPNDGVALTGLSVGVPLVLGVVVTVLSAWAPARRAGAVRPVEGMRSGDASSGNSLVKRTVWGLVAIGLGAAIAGVGVAYGDGRTSHRAILVGAGAVAVIVGTFLASPALSLPIVPRLGRVIGAPFGAIGRLAATNSRRNPRRTATTAFALTLGVALVSIVGMLGASMKASISEVVESSISADYVVAGPPNGQFPLPTAAVDELNRVPGVGNIVVIGTGPFTIGGQATAGFGIPLSAYVQGDLSTAFHFEDPKGSLNLTGPGFIADADVARERGWSIGDRVPLSNERLGEFGTAELVGTYAPNPSVGPAVISRESLQPLAALGGSSPATRLAPVLAFVNAQPGASASDVEALGERLKEKMEPLIVPQVMTPVEYGGERTQLVDQLLNTLYALLALAVIIAILGIVNTLALSVVERTQEVGMLRAVGTHRRQVRRLITLEAVQIAVYGALVGVVIGLFLGWAFLRVLETQGIRVIAVPWEQIAAMILGSGVVGVLAAVWPAIKASRTPPLAAIAD